MWLNYEKEGWKEALHVITSLVRMHLFSHHETKPVKITALTDQHQEMEGNYASFLFRGNIKKQMEGNYVKKYALFWINKTTAMHHFNIHGISWWNFWSRMKFKQKWVYVSILSLFTWYANNRHYAGSMVSKQRLPLEYHWISIR